MPHPLPIALSVLTIKLHDILIIVDKKGPELKYFAQLVE